MKKLERSEQAIASCYREAGWEQLLLMSPVDNPRNVLDFSLYLLHHTAWVNAFFQEAGLKDAGRQSTLVEPPLYSILNRSNSTLAMTYTFDPDINFEAHSPDMPHLSSS